MSRHQPENGADSADALAELLDPRDTHCDYCAKTSAGPFHQVVFGPSISWLCETCFDRSVVAPFESETLALAFVALAALVRADYPERLSLFEIAKRWGDLDREHLDALAEVESVLGAEPRVRVRQHPPNVAEVEL